MSVPKERRFTSSRPCPVCGGNDRMPRGNGERCFGFISEDGRWAHCTRDEHGDGLEYNVNSGTYAHKLTGDCRCGVRHDPNPQTDGHRTWPTREIEETYDYRDANGKLLFQAVRYAPKGFSQRKPDGVGGWIWNLDGVERVLYRLPELLKVDPRETIYLVEGEKDANRLAFLGLTATTNPQGAKKWRKEYTVVLRGRRIAIVPDNDEEGCKHARMVAEELSDEAESVKVVTLPNLPPKGDVSDWLNAGGTPDKLSRLVEETPEWRSSAPTLGESARESKLGTITAADLMALELPPATWIVPDILPEGVAMLAGKPKLGKSWMALGMSLAVATGGVALGTKCVDQGSCLYLALEDNVRRLQRRLKKLLRGDEGPEKLHFHTEWPRLDDGGVEQLREWLGGHPDASLVVIDTLAKVRSRQSGKNVYAEDYATLEPLLPLASEHGVAIMVVHHLRKGEATDPLDEISGSTGLTGGVDGVLVLKRDRSKADATLHVDGRDIEESAELALRWDANIASWAIVGDADEYRQAELRRDIIRVLEEAGEGLGPKEVTKRLEEEGKKVNNNTVKQRMWQMAKDGQLVNEDGKYSPTNHNLHNLHNHHDHGYGGGPAGVTQVMQSDEHNNPTTESETGEDENSCSPVTEVTQVTAPSDLPQHSIENDSRAPGVSASEMAS